MSPRSLSCLKIIVLSAGLAFAASPLWAADAPTASGNTTATAPAAAGVVKAAPVPTLDQRISALEAYINNGDPTAALKDAKGNVPDGLTTAAVGVPGPGHNAWMMASAALVLFMTLPGLALFYGGLVRRKNVLSVMAQCLGITGLVAILWWAVGYSLVFGKSFNSPFLGGSEFFFLQGVTSAPNTDYATWVSQNVFSMYQLMFAIITPALIVGAIAERMTFKAVLVFMTLWMLLVYFPLAHMVWGITGFMNGVWNASAGISAIDFAGGTVVHMSSGWSALILCLLLGPRMGHGKTPMPPHSMVLCMIGTGMLWVGWYGFNAGSAVASDVIAANAFTTTTMATAVASFTWGMIELIRNGKASVLGFCSGAVAGLVVITPACGFVNSTSGAIIIGVLAAVVPYVACTKLKPMFKYDDALDTFGVHAVGGTLGAFLTGVLVDIAVNPNLTGDPAKKNGVADLATHHMLWIEQLKAMGITLVLAVTGTIIITFVTKAVVGLRPTPEAEAQGLDIREHGEEGYVLEEG
jgi:ammonium transporter, Amt family